MINKTTLKSNHSMGYGISVQLVLNIVSISIYTGKNIHMFTFKGPAVVKSPKRFELKTPEKVAQK